MTRNLFIFSLVCLIVCSCKTDFELSTTSEIPAKSTNTNYYSNAAPLVPQTLIKLPAGSIKPRGWLLKQLELQRDGLNGHLSEVCRWLQKEENAWLMRGDKNGWEEVPYWLKGYTALAAALDDSTLLAEAKIWIDAIIASQKDDGNFGPDARVVAKPDYRDLWPEMAAMWAVQTYAEYTGDERVIPFMTKFYEYQSSLPDDNFLEDVWESCRAGDNIWSIIWLYNRTRDERLLSLIEKTHANAADWEMESGLPSRHNVNIAQGFREPAEYYLKTGDRKDLLAAYKNHDYIRGIFGQVPGGMFGGDEKTRDGYIDPRQGTELCGFVEQMASDEIMLLITGDQKWAENLEDVAFNSFVASMLPNMRAHRYITCPNMPISDSKDHQGAIWNRHPMFNMNPFSSRCCQHNHGMGWPYLNEHLVLATPDNGAALVLYSSCEAGIKVAEGVEVKISEDTHYPFDGKISITISTDNDVEFPLYLRIPSWTIDSKARINGKSAGKLTSGSYLKIVKIWKDGDKVELDFPMEVSMRTWAVNQNSISVDYGPLTMSLKIGEEYREIDAKTTCVHDSYWYPSKNPEDWPAYDIYPTTAWNYSLDPSKKVTVIHRPWPEDDIPFTHEGTPLEFKAKGRLIPEWGYEETGFVQVLPDEHAHRSNTLDTITLIPMGAARLRISAFPPANCQSAEQ